MTTIITFFFIVFCCKFFTAFMPHCIDKPNPTKVSVESFNGAKWESTIKKKGKDLAERSKT